MRCPSPRPESGRRRPAGGGLLEVTAAADGLPDELARPLAAAQAPGLSSLSIQNDSDIIRVMSPGPLAFLANHGCGQSRRALPLSGQSGDRDLELRTRRTQSHNLPVRCATHAGPPGGHHNGSAAAFKSRFAAAAASG